MKFEKEQIHFLSDAFGVASASYLGHRLKSEFAFIQSSSQQFQLTLPVITLSNLGELSWELNS